MERLLFTATPSDGYNGGLIFALFIGVFYMFGFVYFIYKKFLSIIFEDLICLLDGKENEETYRPIVYSILNSLQFMVLCFFSTFSSESDLGIAAIIGSDCFNTFFVLAIIFIKFKDANHGTLDTWITFRDTFIYILGLLSLLLFMEQGFVNLWAAIIFLVYYFINYLVLSSNQDIKEKVMEWLGLNNEDNEFNSDEHFHCKRRRESSSNLSELGCYDPTDPNLIKKLNRMEALLVIRFQTNAQDHKLKRVYLRFQKAVYQTIFATRNLAKLERAKRAEQYKAMYKPRIRRDYSQNYQDDNPQNEKDKQVPSIQSGQNNEQNPDQDNHPLIQKKDSGVDRDRDQVDEDANKDQVINRDDQPPEANPADDSYQDGGINLKMPKSIEEKIVFIIFFPVHLILYMLPNYLENPIPKKLVLCFFLNIVLLCGCMFLIDWWLLEISIGANIPLEVLGIIFGGMFLSMHFLEYNYKVAKEEKQLEFVQSFFQIGICKTSLAPAIPWMFKVIVKLNIDVHLPFRYGFIISIAIFMGIITAFLIMTIVKRFRISADEGVKMGILYLIFIVSSTVVISIYQDK